MVLSILDIACTLSVILHRRNNALLFFRDNIDHLNEIPSTMNFLINKYCQRTQSVLKSSILSA